jgi:uncharacterized protein YndB with AHSA1/START domain
MDTPVIAAEAGMLIRRPVADVFQAVVDPDVTTKFWFTRSSGKLEPGTRVRWEWDMYGVSADVDVETVEVNRRIVLRWPAYDGLTRTTVEWTFTPRPRDTTFVAVTNTGFGGEHAAVARQAVEATGGFTLVLAGMKALLERDITLNLIADRHPDRVAADWDPDTGRA